MPFLGVILGFVGNLFGGIFNWKQAQAETVQKTIDLIGNIDKNDAQSVAALANSLQIIMSQGSWLEKNWRSWLMVGLMMILFCSFFGYVPPHFNDALSPMMEKCFGLLEIGLGGYIARRGITDIVRSFNIAGVLKTLIEKKLV